jgi:hypothetical protein
LKYSAPLVNLAILETLKSADYQDEIDLFIPYIAIAIKNLTEVPFTAESLKQQLIADFGIDAPIAAIDILLARAKKRKLVRIENHSYFPNNESISVWKDKYSSRSDEIEEALDLISNEFIQFTIEKYNKTLNKDDAISLIYEFLRENIGDSALLAAKNKVPIIEKIQNSKHLTASFLTFVHRSRRDLWPSFEMITRGVMLAGYLTYADQISSKKQYKNMSVFLDTPIILGLLGYSGDSKAKTLIELIEMLIKYSVDVAIFSDTLREIEGILGAWSNDLKIKRYDRFNPKTLELLHHKGIDAASIETKIILLEKDIENLGIRIQKGFKFNYKFNCDVSALENKIKDEFHGRWVDPRHDADTLSKIHNSREGQFIHTLNETFSIFITPNSALADISQNFFGIAERSIPYVASDRWLTTMFWFKHPEIFKGLPEKMLVTCAYGAMFSDNGYWKKFSERLDTLHSRKEITSDDFILVRYDSGLLLKVHDISVDKGMNYSDENIFDVVNSVKEKILSEKDEQIQKIRVESENDINRILMEKDQTDGKYNRVIIKLKKAILIASISVGWSVFSIIVSAILIVAYVSIPKELISSEFSPVVTSGITYTTMFIITFVIDLFGKIFNLTIHDIRRKTQNLVCKWLTNKLIDNE